MGRNKKNAALSLKEHVALGAELSTMSNRLMIISIGLANRYGKSSVARSQANQTLKSLDKFRCLMDGFLAEELPDDFAASIYYGCPEEALKGVPLGDDGRRGVPWDGEKEEEEDEPIDWFLEDCCVVSRGASVRVVDVRAVYEEWCEANDVTPFSGKRVAMELAKRGIRMKGGGVSRRWHGMKLKPQEEDPFA